MVKVWGRVIGPGGGCGAGRARESRCYREALLEGLVCGMRMEGAHRHERKVGAREWWAHTDTKGKLVRCTPANLGWGTGAREMK